MFKHTKFGAYLPIVPVAAAPRSDGKEILEAGTILEPYGIDNLLNMILYHIDIPNRENTKKQHFKFAIDHCF